MSDFWKEYPTIIAAWKELAHKSVPAICKEIELMTMLSDEPVIKILQGNFCDYMGGSTIVGIRNIKHMPRMLAIVRYFQREIGDYQDRDRWPDERLLTWAKQYHYREKIREWINDGRPISCEYIYESIEAAREAVKEKSEVETKTTGVQA